MANINHLSGEPPAGGSACPPEEVGAVGLVYVADGEEGPMAAAAAGQRVDRPDDRPPWIVVDHHVHSVIVAKWPGRLLKVRVLRSAAEQPLVDAGYTRATAVDVLEALPLAVLFGSSGEAVVELLNAIPGLSVTVIAALGEQVDAQAAAVHNAAWDRWLARVDPGSPFIGEEHAGVLAMGAHASRSPVGAAPSILHAVLRRHARDTAGEGAFIEDEGEPVFNASWSRAAACLQHALIGVGAEESLLTAAERAVLVRAWKGTRRAPAP